ncbi:ParA family protein [Persicobacter psychrovividus]|uniref:CobQ/CobB/MinD/ParA nucleotide binding domain-containing protein n=1 Tax=Persicobacter psychrovividus TaxID=387638 RepID=A0ABN6LBZ5_9BACT|nr:hypothetical protein PEPS_30030 [Persicobacter psychrovividus]
MIITFANNKGGVGKTSILAMTAAAMFYLQNRKVAILDTDPQQSISVLSKFSSRKHPEVFTINRKTSNDELIDLILDLKSRFDDVLVDTSGYAESEVNRIVLSLTDITIVPTICTTLDFAATADFIQSLNYVHNLRKQYGETPMQIFVLANKVRGRVKHEALVKNFDAQFLGEGIKQHVKFEEVSLDRIAIDMIKSGFQSYIEDLNQVIEPKAVAL